MWARVIHDDIQFMERYWWCFLTKYRSSKSKVNDVFQWGPPFPGWKKFNVVGVAMEDEAGCNGVLTNEKGVTRSLFSGLIKAIGSKMAKEMAIKIALEMYIDIGWHVKLPLIIKSSSCNALEQLLERNHRLWMLWNLFIGIDCYIN
ncbi:hypothetical protein J1N35_013408 [Gossypium stocksii]|uniref:RNase H type-1 domain-containing protein n=1 Tax=Gossypium stocksii TaxID=47602 RepID=A0A9D4A900_9ROSI|nr:hypothetical protein J1N35_013408 [Gossypium stocksii]